MINKNALSLNQLRKYNSLDVFERYREDKDKSVY